MNPLTLLTLTALATLTTATPTSPPETETPICDRQCASSNNITCGEGWEATKIGTCWACCMI
ncbi:hypothetical protein P280DRAFT_469843 [Massarina eburnea CBS 473.64]|uniref:CBM1 domain-containing protein n=1 Tax=Massarina eburnea CBS 473.64 TaxID=1395130 RepID=A0A6A6RX48_9PLEO|nr:hypothetical protein P280DRAFT_469843 [Massarina eburnea CBS 473.64]